MTGQRKKFPVEHMEQRPCPCGKEMCRPNQRDGYACHAAAQKRYLARQKAKHDADHAIAVAAMTARQILDGVMK